MTSTEYAEMTPAEIDEAWGPLAYATAVATGALANARKGIARRPHDSFYAEQLARAEAALAAAEADEAPFETEWVRRGGWTRAWLCTSAHQGHIHRSHRCPSLRPGSSMLALAYTLSGADEAEIVAAAGETACTKCFPSAPAGTGIAAAAGRAVKLAEAATHARRALPDHEARAAELTGWADALAGLDPEAAGALIEAHGLRHITGRVETKRNVTTAAARLRKRAGESAAFAAEARQAIAEADAAGVTEDYRPGLVPAFNR